MDAVAPVVFCRNLVATCTQDMDISMDIHVKSVDMDMDMDGKLHIHGKPHCALDALRVH